MVQFGLFAVSSGTVRVWHSNTYRLENTLNYGMERVWCISGQPGSNSVAIGYDEGSIIIKVCLGKSCGHFQALRTVLCSSYFLMCLTEITILKNVKVNGLSMVRVKNDRL